MVRSSAFSPKKASIKPQRLSQDVTEVKLRGTKVKSRGSIISFASIMEGALDKGHMVIAWWRT